MNRRDVLRASGIAMALRLKKAAADEKPAPRRRIMAFVVYPEFTALDLVGPHQVLSAIPGFETHLVGKSREPIRTDAGLLIQPTMSFSDCPEDLSLLFVPGGTAGTVRAMGDADLLTFLKSRGPKSNYVTSVCTGSLVLGAAGLLRGYKATSHWAALDILPILGAEAVDTRVVWDRNRATGGGVTAGIDFGLEVAAKLANEQVARTIQLAMEYDPKPPFRSGSPKQAGPEATNQLRFMFASFIKSARLAAEKAKESW